MNSAERHAVAKIYCKKKTAVAFIDLIINLFGAAGSL